ncbi:hypothetical protein [Sunxiuqinia dokdonensis]|uniref:Fibronectin type-III domain-containing protein n=1 Tax=Sunxiuqinia dokdonensis TaxID=1409788 RepID=A0A0L8V8F1_9BACT|nr:hypothetical protein [Sunxiuqinia dokdonensis]KOH44482.1 hypothetical protein NC99_27120 [Sunxiuqinia dokdonensis]
MKKFFTLLSLFLVMGMSANVMAQTDSGTTPFVGSEHDYSVTQNGTNTYLWDVTSDVAGENSVVPSVATLSATTGNSISITWVNPVVSSTTTYYVHVIENDGSCTNRKVLAVQPQNAFEMDIVSIDGDLTPLIVGNKGTYCAADVAVLGWNQTNATTLSDAQDFNYDYGTTYLYYRIEAKGINLATTSWKPSLLFSNTNVAGSDITATWGTTAPSGVGPQSGYTSFAVSTSTATEISVPTDNQYIYIEVAVDNNTTNETGNEGTSAQNIEISLTGMDGNNNGVTQINGTSDVDDDIATNDISARPNTSQITTDN